MVLPSECKIELHTSGMSMFIESWSFSLLRLCESFLVVCPWPYCGECILTLVNFIGKLLPQVSAGQIDLIAPAYNTTRMGFTVAIQQNSFKLLTLGFCKGVASPKPLP